ncbi:threonylcarbamoyl-AMP synthase [Persicimonas caeni]|uniref:L-threonylcarbamoyladenylate synthase n=1 Tax=Persicimonas caeni TaxID=2292766 RepID=A0A4Y6PMZ7_PERCE|nr:L-threonylcarbamoyladenylate synthase [Persicimonas caeni]QDG49681.1 threonylcarbamoyl-AMP synthase [Persicimonas caeni]QED30902.1 threonylcarbamoyl-AMP synthase [Persicimonas caeni]
MDIIKYDEATNSSDKLQHIVNVLEDGGVVCLPCNGKYRLIADLADEAAVMGVMQAKRRVSKAPSLVFVADEKMLDDVADDIDPKARQLIKSLWPGPLTIRFDARRDLPRDVRKILVKATGKVGIRIPDDEFCHKIVEKLGRPIYVSSANKENKHGETSPAQIRQNFFGRIGLFIDAGDLNAGPSSTVVEVKNGEVKVVRDGHVPAEKITETLSA